MAQEPLARAFRQLRRLLGAPAAEGASDAELLECFVTRRDENAFALLMRRHGPLVLSVCRRLLTDAHAVDDAYQATFIVLVRRASSLRREGTLGGWLHGVATRVALKARMNAARRRGREQLASGDEGEVDAVSLETDAHDLAAQRELCQLLDTEVSRLPEKYRTALVLCDLEGKTHEEAARELGCPAGSMSWRLTQAREQLRDRLARRGIALASTALAAVLAEQSATAAVPPLLCETTLQAAGLLVAGESPAGVVSANAAALAESTVQALSATGARWTAALVLAITLVGGGAGFVAYRNLSADSVADNPLTVADSTWVEERVRDWQPTPAERSIDRIGWASDLRTALALAREHHRPVFLFTHEGRIFTGRCGGSAFNLRAYALMDDRIVAVLNRSFVPVCSANNDFVEGGAGSEEERKERDRFYHTALDQKMFAGTDCLYIVAPDGTLFDTVSIKTAKKADVLLERLQDAVGRLQTASGAPVVLPKAQSVPPAAPADSLVLHLTGRVLDRKVWCEFPAEDWLVLPPEQWGKLLPDRVIPGERYTVDSEVSAGLLTHVYPQTENNVVATNRLDRQELRGQVVSVRDGIARVRLDGELHMKHAFYPNRPDDYFVTASLTGILDFDVSTRQIRSLRLVTREASYGPWTFGVAVRSLP